MAIAPTRSGSADASAEITIPGSTGRPAWRPRASHAAFAPTRFESVQAGSSRSMNLVKRLVDDNDPVRLVGGKQLVASLCNGKHLFESNTKLVDLAVLGLEGEGHARLDLLRVIK